jgi:hypothetical protein
MANQDRLDACGSSRHEQQQGIRFTNVGFADRQYLVMNFWCLQPALTITVQRWLLLNLTHQTYLAYSTLAWLSMRAVIWPSTISPASSFSSTLQQQQHQQQQDVTDAAAQARAAAAAPPPQQTVYETKQSTVFKGHGSAKSSKRELDLHVQHDICCGSFCLLRSLDSASA